MMGEQMGKLVLAQPHSHEALQDVEIGIAVALDEDRSVVEDGDIPADHDTIVELAVPRHRKRFGFFPTWNSPSLNRRACVWMFREPPELRVRAEIARSRQRSQIKVDERSN